MHKKFKINRTKIKGGCQSRRKVVNHDSKSDLPLLKIIICQIPVALGTKLASTCFKKLAYLFRLRTLIKGLICYTARKRNINRQVYEKLSKWKKETYSFISSGVQGTNI